MTATLKASPDGTQAILQVGGVDKLTVDQSGNATIPGALTQGGFATQKMLLIPAKATTSGTFIDFSPADGTGIPSWAKRITIMFNGVSTNGSSLVQVQAGTSEGVVTSGYSSNAQSTSAGATSTTGFVVDGAGAATHIRSGALVLHNVTGNTWVASGDVAHTQITNVNSCGGTVTLGATLDRIRITAVNGTDTTDGGSIALLVEGY